MLALSFQKLIVKAAAVAHAAALAVKGQPGHQHQGIFLPGNRLVTHRLGDAAIAFFYPGKVGNVMKKHGIPVHFGNSHSFAVGQGLGQNFGSTHLLIVR